MGAADPTYPLYPIVCSLAAATMLVSLSTNIVRRNWNLGVASLCFWLCLENVFVAVNAIIWSDSADVKLYAWCDISSHLEVAFIAAQPMASLLISRRLYLIARLQPLGLPGRKARLWDHVIQWMSAVIAPILFAGPIYYVIQGTRFNVLEGRGCSAGIASSIVSYLLVLGWATVPLFVSVIIYDPRVAWTFYRHHKDVIQVLHSEDTVSRSTYLRIFAIASLNICVILPLSIVETVLIWEELNYSHVPLPFYAGWHATHAHWDPVVRTYAEVKSGGGVALVATYIGGWLIPVHAFAVFGFFGLTQEARASYLRSFRTVGGWFGWKPALHAQETDGLDTIEFGTRPSEETTNNVQTVCENPRCADNRPAYA